MPMLVLSPHYDDAVLSCGRLIGAYPGCRVLTVFAGLPQDAGMLTDWDNRCGFNSADQAMQMRSRENAKALTVLGAWPTDLEWPDAQYRADAHGLPAGLAADIGPWLAREPRLVSAPLGLFHEDHVLLSDAVLQAMPLSGAILLLYEDQPYRGKPDLVRDRLAQLQRRGFDLALHRPPRAASALLKQQAMAAYRSQLGELGLQRDALARLSEEHYWEIRAPGVRNGRP